MVVVDQVSEPAVGFETGKTAGFDFGLKTFLTCSEKFDIQAPQFFKTSLGAIRQASRQHSRKQKGASGREKARKHLARQHEAVANRRRDWFWKLAHRLTNQFDVLCFETLNLKAMQKLWGRKIGELGFREFLDILEWVATKKGKQLIYIDPWYPSTKTCACCGHRLKELELSVRKWRCPDCQSVNDRDSNAAINIKKVGISTLGVGDVRQSQTAISV